MNLSDMVRKMQELGYETDDAEELKWREEAAGFFK